MLRLLLPFVAVFFLASCVTSTWDEESDHAPGREWAPPEDRNGRTAARTADGFDSSAPGGDDPESFAHDDYHGEEEDLPETIEVQGEIQALSTMTVDGAVWGSCSTTIVAGLTEQLIAELNCIRPGTMASIAGDPNITLGPAASRWMQTSAAAALRRVAARGGGGLYITSGLRSIAQQYLLYRWQGVACGIGVAAPPGASNHNGGLAIDIGAYGSWRSLLQSEGWAWLGSWDPVHFDYIGGGIDIRSLSVLAFQRLWNRNNPGERLSEDGVYGPATEARLRRSPAAGFPTGACGSAPAPEPTPTPEPEPTPPPTPEPEPTPEPTPPPPADPEPESDRRDPDPDPDRDRWPDDSTDRSIGFVWTDHGGRYYRFEVVAAPPAVREVVYTVDGWNIGSARSTGFIHEYHFSATDIHRNIEVVGLDGSGTAVAWGYGVMDTTDHEAPFIRQVGDSTYEFGLDRVADDVGHVRVFADGTQLVDGGTGRSEAGRTERFTIRSRITSPGLRTFEILLYGPDNAYLGTYRRQMEIW